MDSLGSCPTENIFYFDSIGFSSKLRCLSFINQRVCLVHHPSGLITLGYVIMMVLCDRCELLLVTMVHTSLTWERGQTTYQQRSFRKAFYTSEWVIEKPSALPSSLT